ncbi:hypothetical protein FLONG3_479 [Fusarium longipes]|uniref:Uncharacterized protein n=1 Tax=Fusarium longipes TaxID=694270 RepID=A0A395TAT0_9HYPO|nr:hypothetical protein FLONG3_479 [Fusarium longipes]
MNTHYIATWKVPAKPDAVPRSTVQHLLESMSQITRLVAEQDLQTMDLQAKVEKVDRWIRMKDHRQAKLKDGRMI